MSAKKPKKVRERQKEELKARDRGEEREKDLVMGGNGDGAEEQIGD